MAGEQFDESRLQALIKMEVACRLALPRDGASSLDEEQSTRGRVDGDEERAAHARQRHEGLPRRDRARAHARVAEWIERQTGDREREFAELLGKFQPSSWKAAQPEMW